MTASANKGLVVPVTAILLIVLLGLYHGWRKHDLRTVSRVIDGDTIRLDDGRIVRLIGVDAPEVESRFSKEEPFGQESRRYLGHFIQRKKVFIEPGDPPADRYRRSLAYVYLGDILVNGRIIRDGWARSCRQPDHPWHDLFLSYENEARSRGLGIWSRKKAVYENPGPE